MKLFYQKLGTGQPLIMLHGLFGMSDNMMLAAKKLSEDFLVIVPDLRNHGRSHKTNDWDYFFMSEDIVELMEELNLLNSSLLGHSMGGKLAMQFALLHPEKTKNLIVADIAPKKYPVSEDQKKIIRALSSIELEKIKSRKEVQELLIPFDFEDDVLQFLMKNLHNENGNYSWRFNLHVISENIEKISGAISSDNKFSGETLFIRAEKSNYILDSDELQLKNLFPSASIRIIEGARHWVHADKPVEFVQMVKSFLNNG